MRVVTPISLLSVAVLAGTDPPRSTPGVTKSNDSDHLAGDSPGFKYLRLAFFEYE
jgi:hypothetical protein